MSTPHGSHPANGSHPTNGSPPEWPADAAVWGRPPAGGWGGPPPDRTPYREPRYGEPRYSEPRYSEPRYGDAQPYGPPGYGQVGTDPYWYVPPPQRAHADRRPPIGQALNGQPPYGQAPNDQGPYGPLPHDQGLYGHAAAGQALYGQPSGPPHGEQGYAPSTQYAGQPDWAPPVPGQDDGTPATQHWAGRPGSPSSGRGDLERSAPGRSGRSLLLVTAGMAAVVLVVVAVLGFVTPGFFVTRVFDTVAVEAGVERVLTSDYGLQDVSGVTCGDRIEVAEGATFTCRATVGVEQVSVPVRITSDSGAYEVGPPS